MLHKEIGDRPIVTAGTLLVLALLLTTAGCSALAAAAWVAGADKAKPEYGNLKEQKVAVVCRPMVNLSYRDSHVASDLGRSVNRLLQRNLPKRNKVTVIDQQEVELWTDEHLWEEYVDVGKALKADVVIGIDIEGFSLYQGQTVYQGNTSLMVHVLDCHTGETLFEKPLPRIVYPPNSVVPASERPERLFRREFLNVVAEEVGKLFYPYDYRDNFAMDAKALK